MPHYFGDGAFGSLLVIPRWLEMAESLQVPYPYHAYQGREPPNLQQNSDLGSGLHVWPPAIPPARRGRVTSQMPQGGGPVAMGTQLPHDTLPFSTYPLTCSSELKSGYKVLTDQWLIPEINSLSTPLKNLRTHLRISLVYLPKMGCGKVGR